jgi:hypothetical protein
MKTKKLLSTLLAALVPPLAAHAAEPMTTSEMSAVRGHDGSIAIATVPAPGPAQDGLAETFAAVLMNPRDASVLNASQFSAALAAAGWPAAAMPGYDGQAVTQYKVDSPPVTFSLELSDLFRPSSPPAYTGPSMGTITVTDFDARGTTVWTWIHH